jgi:phosphatidylglycerophosphate synthase
VLDRRARARLGPIWAAMARGLGQRGVTPNHLTLLGLLLAVVAAVAAGRAMWPLAAVLWLVSRIPDGMDGQLARMHGGGTELGGFLDIVADFVGYGAFVVGIGIGAPDARVACLVLLLAYYANGTAFLAYSSVAERLRRTSDDEERTLNFVGGLTEGTETIAAHALIALLPGLLPWSVWAFAAAVWFTVGQRVVFARRELRDA